MSIPPLVCSTPPPPEQFDDEKDIEEFSTNYNLPLDDMDDSLYAYNHIRPDITCEKDLPTAISDYHTHNDNYESNVPEYGNNVEHLPNGDVHSGDSVNSECEKECGSLQLNKGTIRIDEDNNIEDLDLKVDVISVDTDKIVEQLDEGFQEFTGVEKLNTGYNHDTSSVGTAEEVTSELTTESSSISPFQSDMIKSELMSEVIESKKYLEDIPNEKDGIEHCQNHNEFNLKDNQDKTLGENMKSPHYEEDLQSCEILEHDTESKLEENIIRTQSSEFREGDEFDAFQDFDAFKTSTSFNDEVEDDWAKADIANELIVRSNITKQSGDSDGDDFDTFQGVTHKDIILIDSSKGDTTFKTTELCDKPDTNKSMTEGDIDDDDDFGDFDAYQSTPSVMKVSELNVETETTTNKAESIVQSETLNLQSGSKELIFGRIQESFYTLYPQDDDDDDKVLCRTLESQLSECWGHLMDSETRQPYCRSWNSSAGQKTLLKSLGIDSRNILFGPKWNLGMPRYAANLSAAPLQPLQPAKPPGASSQHSVNRTDSQHSIAKSSGAKPAAEWNLSQESQESRDKVTAETNHKKHIEDDRLPREFLTESVLQKGSPYPSSGPSYSSGSTPHLHPPTNPNFHQISLPDTHIFTPTDSETPRSQTIHYHTPLPEEVLTVQITTDDSEIHQSGEQDDDFDDFQGSIPQDSAPKYQLEECVEVMKKDTFETVKKDMNRTPIGVYQSISVLEPVKIEPTMPTLNWPDPGEIKETFDDFSEFVSHSDWGDGTTSSTSVSSVPVVTSNTVSQFDLPSPNDLSRGTPFKLETVPAIASVALLSNSKTTVLNEFEGFTKPIFPLTTTKLETSKTFVIDDFDTFQSAKPETASLASKLTYPTSISSPSVPMSNLQNATASPTLVPLKFQTGQTIMSPSKSSYFQMSQTHSLENQPIPSEKNTQQILQPLSLESFSNSQINWPDPGIDIHQLSRFNPIHSVHSLKNSTQNINGSKEPPADDDGWGDFVSMKPATNQSPKHITKQIDDSDDWTDFVSNTGSKQVSNGVNTISFNVATNLSMSTHKLGNGSLKPRTQSRNLSEIPTLNYVTPKTNSRNHNNHFQNL